MHLLTSIVFRRCRHIQQIERERDFLLIQPKSGALIDINLVPKSSNTHSRSWRHDFHTVRRCVVEFNARVSAYVN
jgi:hypothetical protein